MSNGLSVAQSKALAALTNEWQSASEIGWSMNTLDALVNRGLAERERRLGSSFRGFERTQTDYRLATPTLPELPNANS